MRPVSGRRNQRTLAGTATVTVARPPAIRLGHCSHLVKDVATADGLRAPVPDTAILPFADQAKELNQRETRSREALHANKNNNPDWLRNLAWIRCHDGCRISGGTAAPRWHPYLHDPG